MEKLSSCFRDQMQNRPDANRCRNISYLAFKKKKILIPAIQHQPIFLKNYSEDKTKVGMFSRLESPCASYMLGIEYEFNEYEFINMNKWLNPKLSGFLGGSFC